MIKICISILFGLFVINSNAQSFSYETKPKSDVVDYEETDLKPEYLGGYNEFIKYVTNNLHLDEVENISGTIKISFIIEINGRVGNIKIEEDIKGIDLAKSAVEALKKCPIWSPGEVDGKRVRVKMILPISIQN